MCNALKRSERTYPSLPDEFIPYFTLNYHWPVLLELYYCCHSGDKLNSIIITPRGGNRMKY